MTLFDGVAMTGLTLYSMPSSGNSYKVRLLLALLGRAYVHVPCEAGSVALLEEGHALPGFVSLEHQQ
jgi:glutathione S-transferase